MTDEKQAHRIVVLMHPGKDIAAPGQQQHIEEIAAHEAEEHGIAVIIAPGRDGEQLAGEQKQQVDGHRDQGQDLGLFRGSDDQHRDHRQQRGQPDVQTGSHRLKGHQAGLAVGSGADQFADGDKKPCKQGQIKAQLFPSAEGGTPADKAGGSHAQQHILG